MNTHVLAEPSSHPAFLPSPAQDPSSPPTPSPTPAATPSPCQAPAPSTASSRACAPSPPHVSATFPRCSGCKYSGDWGDCDPFKMIKIKEQRLITGGTECQVQEL